MPVTRPVGGLDVLDEAFAKDRNIFAAPMLRFEPSRFAALATLRIVDGAGSVMVLLDLDAAGELLVLLAAVQAGPRPKGSVDGVRVMPAAGHPRAVIRVVRKHSGRDLYRLRIALDPKRWHEVELSNSRAAELIQRLGAFIADSWATVGGPR